VHRRTACACTIAALALAGCGSDGPHAIGSGLSGPRGYRATVYASGLRHVSALTYDGNGRLWATTSGSGSHVGDGIWLVEHAGTAARKVVGGLTAPLGLVWVGDRLIVSSLGRVTAFSDFDGVRFGQRRVILRGPVAGGENNNVVLGPKGLLLMGVSASCDHCVPASRYSAAIVSFEPDGSDLRVFASGIRAAYGLAYLPGSDRLFASMNQRDDLGDRTPGDWLAEVRRGQNWGFPRCYGQCPSQPQPVGVLDPHAAAGGVAFLDGTTAVVAEWQLGKVQRVDVATGRTSVFLAGLQSPLPVLASGRGDLLVGDWGAGRVYEITAR
jgi:glucose/arabinose dehydrogenase